MFFTCFLCGYLKTHQFAVKGVPGENLWRGRCVVSPACRYVDGMAARSRWCTWKKPLNSASRRCMESLTTFWNLQLYMFLLTASLCVFYLYCACWRTLTTLLRASVFLPIRWSIDYKQNFLLCRTYQSSRAVFCLVAWRLEPFGAAWQRYFYKPQFSKCGVQHSAQLLPKRMECMAFSNVFPPFGGPQVWQKVAGCGV